MAWAINPSPALPDFGKKCTSVPAIDSRNNKNASLLAVLLNWLGAPIKTAQPSLRKMRVSGLKENGARRVNYCVVGPPALAEMVPIEAFGSRVGILGSPENGIVCQY